MCCQCLPCCPLLLCNNCSINLRQSAWPGLPSSMSTPAPSSSSAPHLVSISPIWASSICNNNNNVVTTAPHSHPPHPPSFTCDNNDVMMKNMKTMDNAPSHSSLSWQQWQHAPLSPSSSSTSWWWCGNMPLMTQQWHQHDNRPSLSPSGSISFPSSPSFRWWQQCPPQATTSDASWWYNNNIDMTTTTTCPHHLPHPDDDNDDDAHLRQQPVTRPNNATMMTCPHCLPLSSSSWWWWWHPCLILTPQVTTGNTPGNATMMTHPCCPSVCFVLTTMMTPPPHLYTPDNDWQHAPTTGQWQLHNDDNDDALIHPMPALRATEAMVQCTLLCMLYCCLCSPHLGPPSLLVPHKYTCRGYRYGYGSGSVSGTWGYTCGEPYMNMGNATMTT